jgi:hypothetical protein
LTRLGEAGQLLLLYLFAGIAINSLDGVFLAYIYVKIGVEP